MKTLVLSTVCMFFTLTVFSQIQIRNHSPCDLSYEAEAINTVCSTLESWSGTVDVCQSAIISIGTYTNTRVRVTADGTNWSSWHSNVASCDYGGCEGITGCASSSDISFQHVTGHAYTAHDGSVCANQCP